VAVLPLESTWALADPDTILLESINRYDDVAVSGDMFILVEYTLEYAVLPTENVSEGWLGRLIDVGGTGQLASVQPFAGGNIPDLGYSRGAYGFYFAEEPIISGTLTVTLEGNPSLSPTPAGLTSDSITQRDASELAEDLRAQALRFENIWDVDLISPVSGGVNRYTIDGEDYFSSALPNLRNLAPDLFILQSAQPDVPEREFDTAYTDAREALFDGTPMNTGFESLGSFLNVPEAVARFIVAMLLAGLAAFLVGRALPNTDFTSTAQIWTGYLVLMGGFWIGLVNIATLGIITVLCVLATATVMFLQRASS
jgi:hypothetical protein